jgi:hypothetical protein
MHFGLVDIGQRWLEGKTRAKMGKHGEFKSPVFIVLLRHCTTISTVTQFNVLGKGVSFTVGFWELLIVVQMDLPFSLLFSPDSYVTVSGRGACTTDRASRPHA